MLIYRSRAFHFLFASAAAAAVVVVNAVLSHGLEVDDQTANIASLRSYQQDRTLQTNSSAVNCTYYTEPFQYFSKVKFVNCSLTKQYLPFEEYPLAADTLEAVKTLSLGDSPQHPEDVPKINTTAEISKLGGPPSFPKDGNIFWIELAQMARLQILRRNDGPPPFTLPKLWENFTIADVAEAVNSEYPGLWQGILLQSLWKEKMKFDTSIFPFHSVNDFGLFIRCTEMNTWAINLICPATFLLKWEVGRLRPEEAAFQVARRMFDDVPVGLQQLVDTMDLQTPEEFTAYMNGAPLHPSWPAMHASSSTISLWLAVVGDLTKEQYCQLLLMDYGIAMGRSVSGVHYITDNIAGLNLGQQIVASALPGYLYKAYGTDKDVVRAKVRSLLFDWKTFNSHDCTLQYYHQ